MKYLLILMFLLSIPLKSYSCGGNEVKLGTFKYNIKLKQKPEGYSFYYRQNDYVVFIAAEWLIGNAKKNSNDFLYPEFNKFLKSSMPLKENTDLYKFNFIESHYYDYIWKIVYTAIASGQVAIMDDDGEWQTEMLNVVKEEKSVASSTYYIGINKDELISRLTCITD